MPVMRILPSSRSLIRFLLVISCLSIAACVPHPASLASAPAAGGSLLGASPTPVTGPVGPTPVPSFVRPTPLPEPTFLVYSVKHGDTLTSIAHAYRTTPRSIAFWSRTEHPSLDPESDAYRPDRIEIGWTLLLIPDATFDEDELPDRSPSLAPSAEPGVTLAPTAGTTAG